MYTVWPKKKLPPNHWWNNLIQYIQVPATSFFEHKLLPNLNLTNYSYPSSWDHIIMSRQVVTFFVLARQCMTTPRDIYVALHCLWFVHLTDVQPISRKLYQAMFHMAFSAGLDWFISRSSFTLNKPLSSVLPDLGGLQQGNAWNVGTFSVLNWLLR